MGGVLHTKASLDVSFVIAKNALAAKYKVVLLELSICLMWCVCVFRLFHSSFKIFLQIFILQNLKFLTIIILNLNKRDWKTDLERGWFTGKERINDSWNINFVSYLKKTPWNSCTFENMNIHDYLKHYCNLLPRILAMIWEILIMS